MYDALIIGRGPAGISAALYTVRAGLSTLILGRRDSPLGKAGKIENYYGFSKPVDGDYLLTEGEKQVERLGATLIEDEVVAIEQDGFFKALTATDSYEGKALLLATGQPPKKVRLGNLEAFEGKGVSYCTTCDGFFYRNLKVAVFGYRDYAIHEAMELMAFTKEITILTNGRELSLSETYASEAGRFRLDNRPVEAVAGGEFLERILFRDGSSMEADGLFIADESASTADFARKLGVVVDQSGIVVDRDMKTNMDGLFAAGDCTGQFKQVSVAVGQGAIAGRRLIEYVRKLTGK